MNCASVLCVVRAILFVVKDVQKCIKFFFEWNIDYQIKVFLVAQWYGPPVGPQHIGVSSSRVTRKNTWDARFFGSLISLPKVRCDKVARSPKSLCSSNGASKLRVCRTTPCLWYPSRVAIAANVCFPPNLLLLEVQCRLRAGGLKCTKAGRCLGMEFRLIGWRVRASSYDFVPCSTAGSILTPERGERTQKRVAGVVQW